MVVERMFKLNSGNASFVWTSCSSEWIHYAVSVHCSILYLFVPFIGRYCKPITSHLYLQQIIQMRRPELYNCPCVFMTLATFPPVSNISWATVGKDVISALHFIIVMRKINENFWVCVCYFVHMYIAFCLLWEYLLVCSKYSILAFSTWLKEDIIYLSSWY